MPDAFDSASNQTYANKAALLAAMAQAGTAGRQAYEQSQADLRAQRAGAVQAALADASRRGAPQAMLESVAYQVGSPYDRANADLGAANQAQLNWHNNLAQATGNYFDETAAAMPVLRAVAQRQYAANEAKVAAANARSTRSSFGGSRAGGAPKFSSSFLKAATQAAAGVHQAAIGADLQQHFGPRAQSAFDHIVSHAKNYGDALAILDAGLKADKKPNPDYDPTDPVSTDQHNPKDIPRPPVFWKDTPVAGRLDYNAMLSYLQRYYAQASPDEFARAQQQVLDQGSY